MEVSLNNKATSSGTSDAADATGTFEAIPFDKESSLSPPISSDVSSSSTTASASGEQYGTGVLYNNFVKNNFLHKQTNSLKKKLELRISFCKC